MLPTENIDRSLIVPLEVEWLERDIPLNGTLLSADTSQMLLQAANTGVYFRATPQLPMHCWHTAFNEKGFPVEVDIFQNTTGIRRPYGLAVFHQPTNEGVVVKAPFCVLHASDPLLEHTSELLLDALEAEFTKIAQGGKYPQTAQSWANTLKSFSDIYNPVTASGTLVMFLGDRSQLNAARFETVKPFSPRMQKAFNNQVLAGVPGLIQK
jgi:hypothetical protein